MKKLVTCLAVLACLGLLMAPPASAVHLTDSEKTELKNILKSKWDFYGSARMSTFWTSSDQEWTGDADDSTTLGHNLQGNSRIGSSVDMGNFGGHIELGLREGDPKTRLIYGNVDLGEGELIVGKDYGPFGADSLISRQVYDTDNKMRQYIGFTVRLPQLKYTINGVSIALVTPQDPAGGSAEKQLPQIQIGYNTMVNGVGVNVAGLFQSYNMDDQSGANDDPGAGDSLTSYGLTANLRLSQELLGAVYINVGGYYGQNLGDAGDDIGFGPRAAKGNYPTDDAATAEVDGQGNVDEDATSFGGLAVVGTRVNRIGLEAGIGYGQGDRDDLDTEAEIMTVYGHANIPLIESGNAFIVPEVGWNDFGDNPLNGNDLGSETYAGMKTQINF